MLPNNDPAPVNKEDEPSAVRVMDEDASDDAELERASARLDALLHEREGLEEWLDLLKAEFHARESEWTDCEPGTFTSVEYAGYVHGIHATAERLRSLAIDVEYVMFYAS